MTSRPRTLLALPTAIAVALGAAALSSSPVAADVTCTGTIGAVDIDDTVVVPSGASCTLDGTRVDGNVLVGPSARLDVLGASIEGNLQDDDNAAGPVTIRDSYIGGSVQLEQGSSATITDTTIDSDLQLESNDGALRAERNTIGGNLQANQNTGGLVIVGNTIDGNLQCQSNVPAPTGGDNVVHGSAEDQCADLTGSAGGGGGTPPSGGAFHPVTPARLADTRTPNATVDGLFSGDGPVAAGTSYRIQVTGRGGVPTGARAAVFNATVVAPEQAGYATLWPCDAATPEASNLNYTAGQAVPNAVVAKLDADGGVCVYTSATTHVVLDVNAVVPSGPIVPGVPARLADTRSADATIDGQFSGAGPLAGETSYRVQVAGRGGVPIGAAAATLNVTIVNPTGAGFATVHPCDVTAPNASNINFVAGQTVPNAVVAKLDTGGGVCVYSSAGAHVLVDVNAAIAADDDFTPVAPIRLADTRNPGSTVDGSHVGGGPVTPGQPLQVQLAGRGSVGATVDSVVLNVTAVGASAAGFATVYSCDVTPPNASNLNFAQGQTVANAVVAAPDANGRICIAVSAATDILVDVNAFER